MLDISQIYILYLFNQKRRVKMEDFGTEILETDLISKLCVLMSGGSRITEPGDAARPVNFVLREVRFSRHCDFYVGRGIRDGDQPNPTRLSGQCRPCESV